MFWPKRDENGDWRKLQNEELHGFYRSPNIVIEEFDMQTSTYNRELYANTL